MGITPLQGKPKAQHRTGLPEAPSPPLIADDLLFRYLITRTVTGETRYKINDPHENIK